MCGVFVMGRLALLHDGKACTKPPRDFLEPFIERTENHWYWLGDFMERDLERGAVFSWAAPNERKTRYAVPRLLWQLEHPEDVEKRLLLENTCGLFTCINPAHWRKRRGSFKIPARIVLPESVEAWPVIHHPDMIHSLDVHIRFVDALAALCGRGVQYRGMAKTTVVTCDDCISAWVRLDRPYTEVK